MTMYLSEKEMAEKQKKTNGTSEIQMGYHHVRQIIDRPNGSMLVIGEEEEHAYLGHQFNDIFVAHIDSRGGIDWNVKVPKRQYSIDGHNISYAMVVDEDRLLLFFNDHKRNVGIKPGDPVGTFSWSGRKSTASSRVVSQAAIDMDGNVRRDIIHEMDNKGFPPRVSEAVRLDTRTLLVAVSGIYPAYYQLGKIRLGEYE